MILLFILIKTKKKVIFISQNDPFFSLKLQFLITLLRYIYEYQRQNDNQRREYLN